MTGEGNPLNTVPTHEAEPDISDREVFETLKGWEGSPLENPLFIRWRQQEERKLQADAYGQIELICCSARMLRELGHEELAGAAFDEAAHTAGEMGDTEWAQELLAEKEKKAL